MGLCVIAMPEPAKNKIPAIAILWFIMLLWKSGSHRRPLLTGFPGRVS
jgi:hypothetical protein